MMSGAPSVQCQSVCSLHPADMVGKGLVYEGRPVNSWFLSWHCAELLARMEAHPKEGVEHQDMDIAVTKALEQAV